MFIMLLPLFTAGVLTLAAAASPSSYRSRPYAQHVRRQAAATNNGSLTVDLGYEVYQGWRNETQELDVFYGIRYAKAPTGELRWQAPRAPETNRNGTIDATTYPAQCGQSPAGVGSIRPTDNTASSEDCLFVSMKVRLFKIQH